LLSSFKKKPKIKDKYKNTGIKKIVFFDIYIYTTFYGFKKLFL
jgi:hypothetical protein